MTEQREPAIQNEPIEQRTRPSYTLASPEFFHLLQRIDQTEQKLEQRIIQVEQKLEQKIGQLEQKLEQKIDGLGKWIMATLAAVVIAALGLLADRII